MKRKSVFPLFILLSFHSACGPAPDVPRNQTASIESLNSGDEKKFHSLLLKGEIRDKEKLWSGELWPSSYGSINRRWNAKDLRGFYQESPSREDLLWMHPDEINELSPTEKFDILQGRYHYPLKEEVFAYADPRAPLAKNLKRGWLLASLFHQEPTQKTVTNADGIAITFGSSDIKGLLAHFYENFHKTRPLAKLGVNGDMNPGAFHVALANKVARNEMLILDDGPVLGFVSRVDQESNELSGTVPGTAKILFVRTRVTTLSPAEVSTMAPIRNSEFQKKSSKEFRYKIFVSPFDQVVGGDWLGDERPGLLWVTKRETPFNGLSEGLEALLND